MSNGDIRNFFVPTRKSTSFLETTSKTSVIGNSKPTSKRKIIIEDDDDDVIPQSPDVEIKIKTKKSKTDNNRKSKLALKEVKVTDLFGKETIKRTEPIVKKATKKTETGIHSDDEFDKSLLELDNIEELEQNGNKNNTTTNTDKTEINTNNINTTNLKEAVSNGCKNEKTNNKAEHSNAKERDKKERKSSKNKTPSPSKDKSSDKTTINNIKKEIRDTNKRKFEEFIDNDVKQEDTNKKTKVETTTNGTKGVKTWEAKERNVVKIEDQDDTMDHSELLEDLNESNIKKRANKSLNESALTDEERHERKMHSAALYQKYLNRSGPKHLGTKEMPEGAPNCLKDLAFVLTGVLDSFEREEVVDTIKKYGGEIKSGISKKVTHVLAGDDAGPAKIAKAQELGIAIINEDQFLKMIKNSTKTKHSDNKKDRDRKPSKDRKEQKHSSAKDNKKEKSQHNLDIKRNHDKTTPKKDHEKTSFKNHEKEKTSSKSGETSVKNEKTSFKKDKADYEKIKNVENNDKKATPLEVDEVVKIEKNIKSESVSTSCQSNQITSLTEGSNKDINISNTMWVEKHKPQTLKQIIGQHGEASNVNKLVNWLKKWYVNRKAKLPKPSPWAKNDDGGYYKAALLSGPPGVGKTTTVSLVCKELGFDMVEFNASDTRNKTLIREQIGELLTTNSLSAFASGDIGKQAVSKKHVLVMDEVDGMAGNEDRGGLQELIGLIKSTSVPIICMCNDRNSQKMRSLVNYCYDLRFNRPRVDQIKAAMRSVCCKENIKIPPDVLGQLIISANQDVRQTLNLLSMWAIDPSRMDPEKLSKDAASGKKDVKLGPWEAIRKVFSAEDHKTMSINDKSDLFFYDYSLAPLFVQENYLQVQPHCPKNEVLDRISAASDSIAYGDVIEARIRGSQAWGLLPMQAMFSSVIPGTELSGHVAGQIQFPAWLGKNSRKNKMHRLAQEIHAHTRLSTTGSKSSIYLDYAPYLRDAILNPLIKERSEGIDKSLEVLESYHLLREDLDSLTELSLWPGQRNPNVLVDSKVKAAMTRMYNKKGAALPYAPGAIKKGRAKEEDDMMEDNDDAADEESNDSDPDNDALIKKKKGKELAETSSSDSINKPSTSKGKSRNGKGKKK